MARDMAPASGLIRFGSLAARVRCDDRRRGEDIARIFGTSLTHPNAAQLADVEAEITLSESARAKWPDRPPVPDDGMVLRHGHPRPEIHTGALAVLLDLADAPIRADVAILEPDIAHVDLCVHLAVVFHKLLFLLDRIVLHAAAVRFADRVSVFLGDKGAGKSTVSLRLARAGGTVLGEDHLILKRAADRFLVSGCDERSRLTAKTERYFFSEPLPAEPLDFAGTMKKEVRAAELFASQPYTDHRPDLLFFSRVGTTFRVTPLPRPLALMKLMHAAGRLQRFVDPTDRGRFLGTLSDFVHTVSAYELELSPDLRQLDRLVRFLQDGMPAGHS